MPKHCPVERQHLIQAAFALRRVFEHLLGFRGYALIRISWLLSFNLAQSCVNVVPSTFAVCFTIDFRGAQILESQCQELENISVLSIGFGKANCRNSHGTT